MSGNAMTGGMDQESLEHDYADEFAQTMSGNFPGMEEAFDREFEEGGEERISELMDGFKSEVADKKPKRDEGEGESRADLDDSVYSKEARSALEFVPEQVDDRPSRRESELLAEVALERGRREALEQFNRPDEKPKLARATGIADVDDILREQGLLDTTPELPPEVARRLETLERSHETNERRANIEQRGRAMAADATAKAKAVTAVFKDVPLNAIAELILGGGNGLEAARSFYKNAGCLGDDGFPTRHPSAPARKAMPQATGEAAGRRGADAKPADAHGWAPTDDVEARNKRLEAYGR
jgi:hypothetical protein